MGEDGRQPLMVTVKETTDDPELQVIAFCVSVIDGAYPHLEQEAKVRIAEYLVRRYSSYTPERLAR